MPKRWISLISLCALLSDARPSHDCSETTPPANANHIFNAVHSSMRQWGSSLNHNGMGLFVATVPQGTQLYHGTSKPDRINGTEWLAFEPEHALVFARSRRGPPPGKGGPPHPDDDWKDEDEPWHPPQSVDDREPYMPWHQQLLKEDLKAKRHDDRPLTHTAGQRERARLIDIEDEDADDESHGYLHTYRPKRDLRLLYIDGQSAAKSSKGTLDTQDIVLLHNNPPPTDDDHRPPLRDEPNRGKHPRPGGPMNEAYRAEKMCEIAQNEWNDRIDGFLRMELGFEVILCSFERDLDVERITEAKESKMGGPPGRRDDGDGFNYYKAVASRFDGIGGDRVHVNYDSFVSLFAAMDAIYFEDNREGLPRVRNNTELLRPVHKAINDMVLRRDKKHTTNWQAIVDMVVDRYADRIEYLASGDLKDLASLQAEVDRALRPFIDYGLRNKSAEISRCASQYLQHPSGSLAARAILNVTTELCSTLSSIEDEKSYANALWKLQSLKSWLSWTTWKRCRGCGYHEVCFIPIWPMGSADEREHPKCVSNMSETSRGYWGDMGGPPHVKGKHRH